MLYQALYSDDDALYHFQYHFHAHDVELLNFHCDKVSVLESFTRPGFEDDRFRFEQRF